MAATDNARSSLLTASYGPVPPAAGSYERPPGRVFVEDTEVHAQQVVLAAGTAIPGLLPESGRALGVPLILAGRGVSVRLEASALLGVRQVVRTPSGRPDR